MGRLRALTSGLAAAAMAALAFAGAGHAGGPEEPDRFLLRFTDAYLVYEPDGGAPQIATEGNVLSYGQDWGSSEFAIFSIICGRETGGTSTGR